MKGKATCGRNCAPPKAKLHALREGKRLKARQKKNNDCLFSVRYAIAKAKSSRAPIPSSSPLAAILKASVADVFEKRRRSRKQ